jgi:hypothetical protein
MSYTYTHIKRSLFNSAFQYGYYIPLPRGHLEIYEDNERNVYKLFDRSDLKDFKRWYVECSVEQYGNRCRLTGCYPTYHLEVG